MLIFIKYFTPEFCRNGFFDTKMKQIQIQIQFLFTGFCLIFLALNLAHAQQPSVKEVYKLGSGDKLIISVFNQEELTGEYTINGSGHISMPFIGSIVAKGLSVSDLEQLIVDKLKPEYLLNPRVSIEVINYRPFYIIGEVKRPNSYPYVDGMTYLNAVAIAGGFTYRAKKKYAMVRHNEDSNSEEIKVDIYMKVMPGDIIRIAERIF